MHAKKYLHIASTDISVVHCVRSLTFQSPYYYILWNRHIFTCKFTQLRRNGLLLTGILINAKSWMHLHIKLIQREKMSQCIEINRHLGRVSDQIVHGSVKVDINITKSRSIDLVYEHWCVLSRPYQPCLNLVMYIYFCVHVLILVITSVTYCGEEAGCMLRSSFAVYSIQKRFF